MHTTNRNPDSPAAKRLLRRAYIARKAELNGKREFVRAVYSLEITPQVEARIEAATARARHALNAPFLEQYRSTV